MANIINLAQHAIDSVPELELLPAGTEAELRIINILCGEDKNGDNYIMPFFDVPDEPNVQEISKYMVEPAEGMPESKYNKARRDLLAFGQAFDIDWSGEVNLDEQAGKTGYAILGVSKDGTQNTIRKFLGGR